MTVVVPVFDPGPYIGDLLESLEDQTLDPARWEVVFVDDGSTDGTPDRLERWAERRPNARVIRTPNSGWPGRPRNLGLDAARGRYVFLADHDDRLDPEALERLTAFADEHGSDVVIGRVIGVGRPAPTRIFARTVVDAQRDPALLMTSLTPQKLYRRAFLQAAGIRFPEGPRRLEDHLFVTKAYLRAQRVSIYADHPVYYFVIRDDGRNASRRPVEWAGYYANAAESIGVVDAEAPDEATRLVMRRRWLHTEALGRLRGRSWRRRGDDRDALFAAARDLLRQHYPLAEVDLLEPVDRAVGRLVTAGRIDDVDRVADWEASIRVRPHLAGARIDLLADALELRLLVDRRAAVPLPPVLAAGEPGLPAPAEFAASELMPAGARASVRLRHAPSGAVVDARVAQRVEDGVLRVDAAVDLRRTPALLRGGRWSVSVAVDGVGGTPVDPLTVTEAEAGLVAGTEVRTARHRFRLGVGDGRRVLLHVVPDGAGSALRRIAGRVRRSVRR